MIFQCPVSRTGCFNRIPWGGRWPHDGVRHGTASFFIAPDEEDHSYYIETGNDLDVRMDIDPAGFLNPGLVPGEWSWNRESGERILYGTREVVVDAIVWGFFNQLDASDTDRQALADFLHQHII